MLTWWDKIEWFAYAVATGCITWYAAFAIANGWYLYAIIFFLCALGTGFLSFYSFKRAEAIRKSFKTEVVN